MAGSAPAPSGSEARCSTAELHAVGDWNLTRGWVGGPLTTQELGPTSPRRFHMNLLLEWRLSVILFYECTRFIEVPGSSRSSHE